MDPVALADDCRTYCRRQGWSVDRADEVAQALALLAVEGRCRIERNRAAWIRTVAHRQDARLRIRRAREAPLAAEPAAPVVADEASAIRQLLAILPPQQRRALELRYLEAASSAQAAAELQVSVNAYRKVCVRALLLLRQNAGKFFGMNRGA